MRTHSAGVAQSQSVPAAAISQDGNGQVGSEATSNFPVAATAAISVVASLAVSRASESYSRSQALFIAWRTYRWWNLRKIRRAQALEAYGDDEAKTPAMQSTDKFGGSSYGPASVSYRQSGAWAPSEHSTEFGRLHARESSGAYTYSLADDISSPVTPGTGSFPSSSSLPLNAMRDHSSVSTDILRQSHSRMSMHTGRQSPPISSRPSSMLLAAGPRSSHRLSSYSTGAPSSPRRISGAPHAAHSRVEINLPAPLAQHQGAVVRTGRAELGFDPSAGIGGDDFFGADQIASTVAANNDVPILRQPVPRQRVESLDSNGNATSGSESVANTAPPSESGHGSPLTLLQRSLAQQASMHRRNASDDTTPPQEIL